MNYRIQKIKEAIPNKVFFEECFEDSRFSSRLLADVILNLDNIEHNNLFKCSPLLKKDQEFHLFRKFNYLRYRLLKNTVGFPKSDESPSPKPRPATNLNRIKENTIKDLESIIFRMNEVRNLILKSNLRLLVAQINRYSSQDTFEREEYLSNGYMHILKCIDAFDHRRGFKFSTYCINALKTNLYRDAEKLKRNLCLLEHDDSVEKFPSRDLGFSELNSFYNSEAVQKVFDYLSKKKKIYAEVLKMTYGIGCDQLKQKEIAVKMGYSRTTVQKIRDDALEMAHSIVYDPLI